MNIVIIGAGSFGTALGNILVKKSDLTLWVLARKRATVRLINDLHLNEKYFPSFTLDNRLTATADRKILKDADIIFLAIPSANVIEYVSENKSRLPERAVLVILSKGFGRDSKTIAESLKEIVANPLCSFKGPTFATDLIHNNPSAFTVACYDKKLFDVFKYIFSGTNICLDFSTDIPGVEVVSALKNIYAILLGIIDAYFNSANVRFLILSKAFSEMKEIVLIFGGSEETLFKYCGFGDFSLTALNDLSRNRTLGLLIGKGFLQSNISSSIILEGKRTLQIIVNTICSNRKNGEKYFMIDELNGLFNANRSVHEFIHNLFIKIKESN